jgi:hypothetical protein
MKGISMNEHADCQTRLAPQKMAQRVIVVVAKFPGLLPKVLLKMPLLIVELLKVGQFADFCMTGWCILAIIFYVHTGKLFSRVPAAP